MKNRTGIALVAAGVTVVMAVGVLLRTSSQSPVSPLGRNDERASTERQPPVSPPSTDRAARNPVAATPEKTPDAGAPEARPTANLFVETLDAGTGLPVSAYVEIRVEAHASDSRAGEHDQVLQTGPQGRGRARVPPGRVSGTAWTETLLSRQLVADIPDSRAEATLVFELTLGGVVEGIVLSEDGSPLEGAEVYVPFVNEHNVAFTSAGGRFRYFGFPPDGALKTLRARAEGHHEGFARVAIDPGGSWSVLSDGLSFEERAGPWGTYPSVTLVLPRHTSIRGRVVSPTGSPVVGASVLAEGSYVTSGREGSTDRESTETDTDGKFMIEGLRSGLSHSVLISARDLAQWLEIVDGERRDVDLGEIVLDSGVSLRGVIVDARSNPVHGIDVEVVRTKRAERSFAPGEFDHVLNPDYPGQDARLDSLRLGRSVRTNADGEFVVAGLREGPYTLRVHWGDVIRVHEQEVVAHADSSRALNVTLPSRPAVAGIVRRSEGANPADVSVSLRTQDGRLLGSQPVSPDGGFRFSGLAENGEYELWTERYENGDLVRNRAGRFYSGAEQLVVEVP